ncbi:MAG: hypothetical protein KH405_02910 [Firmicutes bacterium]|nr:hypothetical protein [Bacillota bacterium]
MLEYLLPNEICQALNNLKKERIYEIRIRDGQNVKINYAGKSEELYYGNKPILSDFGTCNKIIAKAAEYSLYSVNNQIVEGFVSVGGGVRIGLCGEIVRENDGVKTIKNFSSLNIRIPHDVVGCSDKVMPKITVNDKVVNTLIVSAPGKGKTTMLRDLSRKLSDEDQNVLIIDERNEICAYNDGKPYFKTGKNCDVITFGNKEFAFSYGIRTMSPDVIITDELMSELDSDAVILAAAGGVKVIAGVHAGNLNELKSKGYLKKLLSSGLIGRYVFLSSETIGTIKCVYDASFGKLL